MDSVMRRGLRRNTSLPPESCPWTFPDYWYICWSEFDHSTAQRDRVCVRWIWTSGLWSLERVNHGFGNRMWQRLIKTKYHIVEQIGRATDIYGERICTRYSFVGPFRSCYKEEWGLVVLIQAVRVRFWARKQCNLYMY
jgi:hypothetical protein